MGRYWKDVHIYVIRCQFRYYFEEIQLFEYARARLRWLAYSCHTKTGTVKFGNAVFLNLEHENHSVTAILMRADYKGI